MKKPIVLSGKPAKQILCLFDYACNTGFSTVSKNIVKQLTNHFGDNLHLDIFAINYFGETYQETDYVNICSAKNQDPIHDPFGRTGFVIQLRQKDYDGIFIIQDFNVVSASINGGSLVEFIEREKDKKRREGRTVFKSIFYFPVDCGLVPLHVKGLENLDLLVAYTEFGKKEMLKVKPKLKDKLKVIPHGNNNIDFYPMPYFLHENEINKFRCNYFGEKKPGTMFIITNINRNQPRKDIPNTVFGFIEAKKSWPANIPKPFLYLHMNPVDSEGWHLPIFMMQTGLKEGVDYMLCPMEIREQGADLKLMNLIYNASDLYLTTTTGEGWGLTVTEAMATKTPVICPNYSSLPEITGYGERAWLLETLYPHCSVVGSMIRMQTDLYEVGEKIIEVAQAKYDDSEIYTKKVEAAHKYTQSLSWKIVCKKWADCFHEIFKVANR